MSKIGYESRVGLAVMDAQTLHLGHIGLLRAMIDAAPYQIVALGSANLHGRLGHPFTFEQRIEMIEHVFGANVFHFVPLKDIDAAADNDDWANYVLRKISGMGLPTPTDYFSGSEIDALWYESAFCALRPQTRAYPDEIATWSHHNPGLITHVDRKTGKRVHIINRAVNGIPSGREIRFLIERRDDRWRAFVPVSLHHFIDWNYPPHLRQDIVGDFPPDASSLPIGTRFRSSASAFPDNVVLEIKDDLQWRPNRLDEKAEYALNRQKGI